MLPSNLTAGTAGDQAGDTPANAFHIVLSTVILAAIDTPGDVDVYQFNVNANKNLSIHFTSLDGTPLSVGVVNPMYTYTVGPFWVGASEPALSTALGFGYITSGIAYVTVASRGGATGNYDLRVVEIEEMPPPIPTLTVNEGEHPTFTGKAEAWNKINFFVNSGYVGTAQADGNGAYSYTPPGSYTGANNTVYALAIDLSSNFSPKTAVFSFNGAMTNPPALGVPVLRASWGAASESYLNAPIFSGTGDPGAIMHVYNGDKLVALTVVKSDGSWDAQSIILPDGMAHLTARQGAAGTFESAPSAAIDILIDATPPNSPSLTVRQSDSTHAEAYGHAEAGSTLNLLVNGLSASVIRIGAQGDFSVNVPVKPDGLYTFDANASDRLLNTSALTHLAYAVPGPGHVYQGSSGNILFQNGTGSDSFQGGAGLDSVVYAEPASHFELSQSGTSMLLTQHIAGEVQDTLTGIERVKFTDETIAFDVGGAAGQAYRLYQAALNRKPDAGGLGFWIANLDKGMSMSEIAHFFMQSPEFQQLYANASTPEAFVTTLYRNVMHRNPEAAGLQFWVEALDSGTTLENALVMFSESPENQANVIGQIQHGIHYLPTIF